MRQHRILLDETQKSQLVEIRDHAAKPYLRERASAILKVGEGIPLAVVGRERLLKPRTRGAVLLWINRFLDEGPNGLSIRPGRGRKPAFSPSDR